MRVRGKERVPTGAALLVATAPAALELLTVVRLRRAPVLDERVFGASQAWFPAVGLLIGFALVGLVAVLDGYLPGSVLGWLLAGTLVGVSGGLHVDGLADTADGVFGGRSREQRLAIMRDGRIGAFGAAAVILALGIKATALASLTEARGEVLLLAPMLGRWAPVPAMVAFPYARERGLGKGFHAAALPWPAPFAMVTALAGSLALVGPQGVALVALCGVLSLLLGLVLSRSLGGLTGDTYGAIVEVCEIAVLLCALALEAEGWLA